MEDNQKLIEKVLSQKNYDSQSRQLIEEMSELTQAINKFWRHDLKYGDKKFEDEIENLDYVNNLNYKNLVEEIADVEICLEQVKTLLKVNNDSIKQIKNFKLNRELERI